MKSTPTLVIPDVHQNHDFLNRILAAERVEDFEHVVFLGDIFDSRDIDFRGPKSAAKTATILKDMRRRLGSKLVLLYGNHDVPYFAEEAFRANGTLKKGYAHWALQELCVRPESHENSEAVHQVWSLAFWNYFKPFALINGHLLSHAGVHSSFLSNAPYGLESLQKEWDLALRDLIRTGKIGRILKAGGARGGEDGEPGGILWQDWNSEFSDDVHYPQIVGHSASAIEHKKGRSWCLDFDQCAYGVLTDKLDVIGI